MIHYEQAYQIMLNHAAFVGAHRVPYEQSLNRVLAESIKADRDMPPFHKSGVDGYACMEPVKGQELRVMEIIPAGDEPTQPLKRGTCSKVMTGAQVPANTTHVVMVERAESLDYHTVRLGEPGRKTNIAVQGEDFRQGDRILPAGTLLLPQHIAILAAVGWVNPLVGQPPSIGLITTGNELVEPHQKPDSGQIRNTNASQLLSQFRKMDLYPRYSGIVWDSQDTLLETLKSSLARHHLTILTGGVSMGDYDYVPEMMEKAGVKVLFHKIAMKPGKPTIFGSANGSLVLGLPGNPVSTFLQFELFVKPLVYKLMGGHHQPVALRLPLGEDIQQKSSDRDSWKPVYIHAGKVYPLAYHGSGHIHALARAEGFICVPAGETRVKKGTTVDVRQI